MHKWLGSVVASVACLWSGWAAAGPVEPFFASVELVATVRNVSASGRLLDADRNYVRDFTTSDLPILPWNVGDRLTVRWEQHSDTLNREFCPEGTPYVVFGGITFDAVGSSLGAPCPGSAASFAQVERAGGGTSPVWDGWESGMAAGPILDLRTGDLLPYGDAEGPYYDAVDGLVVDCCVYLYDPESDEIIGIESNGSESAGLPSWPVQFLWTAQFHETEGGGGMDLYPSQMFGISDWEDPDTGTWRPLGWLEDAGFSVSFDVEWRTRVERFAVPEPAALPLIGMGLLAAGLARRRRG